MSGQEQLAEVQFVMMLQILTLGILILNVWPILLSQKHAQSFIKLEVKVVLLDQLVAQTIQHNHNV